MRPTKVTVIGHEYDVSYVDNTLDVDLYHRESLFGQVDYWTRTIRVYANDRKETDVVATLIHEIIHAISEEMKITCFGGSEGHEDLDLLATGLTDTLLRNNLFGFSIDEELEMIYIEEEEDEDRELQQSYCGDNL